MKLRPAGWMSWQLGALLVLALLCGGALGALVATSIYLDDAGRIAREISRKSTRIHLLELLVQQQMPQTYAALDATPAAPAGPGLTAGPAATPASAPASSQASRPAAAPAVDRARERAVATAKSMLPVHPAAAAASAAKGVPKAPAVAVASAPAVAPASAPGQPVTGEELMLALRGRIEGVPAAKAGVKSIDATGVALLNGGRVGVGQFFPSGEKLLQVDPDSSRVVTNKRQLLLFFPQ